MFKAILLNKSYDGSTAATLTQLARITHEITSAEALRQAPDILAGKICGRLVVNVNA